MKTKKCTKCGEVKDLDQFSFRKTSPDGRKPRCKLCVNEENRGYRNRNPEAARRYHQDYRKANRDKFKAYAKSKRQKDPEKYRIQARAKRERNPEHYRARSKAKYHKNREELLQKQKVRMRLEPEKCKARELANYAQKLGKIIQPPSCSFCGVETSRLDKHHSDYSKPLEVTFLCRRCHLRLHADEAR